jgi:hypothetical protein
MIGDVFPTRISVDNGASGSAITVTRERLPIEKSATDYRYSSTVQAHIATNHGDTTRGASSQHNSQSLLRKPRDFRELLVVAGP